MLVFALAATRFFAPAVMGRTKEAGWHRAAPAASQGARGARLQAGELAPRLRRHGRCAAARTPASCASPEHQRSQGPCY